MATNTVDGGDVIAAVRRHGADDFDSEVARRCFERARSFEHLAEAERLDARERALWARCAERARERFEQETGVDYRSVVHSR